MKRSVVPVVGALLLSGVFGAVDQYLGSLSAHPWGVDISGLSAPWLVLPFLVGCAQRGGVRAALMGGACTFVALTGYCLMTLSPMENARLSLAAVEAFLRAGNYRWFAAGAITGPLFGWAGHRWRQGRTAFAVTVAAVMCLEPLFRTAAGSPIRSVVVAGVEFGVGLAIAIVLVTEARGRSAAATGSSSRP